MQHIEIYSLCCIFGFKSIRINTLRIFSFGNKINEFKIENKSNKYSTFAFQNAY